MIDLYKELGFKQHPFSKFSAEEETEYLNKIFVKPRYFNTLLSDLKSGSSRFILGERGSGKSALVFELNSELNSNNVFSIIIDNYDEIPLVNNDKELLNLIIKSLLKSFVASIFKNTQLLHKLNKQDKEKLALIIRDFFHSISKKEFENAYDKVTKFKSRNLLKKLVNLIFNKPINWAISVGLEIGSDFISKSLNLPKLPDQNFYKEYLPQLKVEELPPAQKEQAILSSYKLLKDILTELLLLIQKSGYATSVIFLDKIDEFKLLDGKINKIVDFTEQVLKDTSLLYLNNLSIVFSIWTEVKIELNAKGVRFDKFKPIDINWTNDDIRTILQTRLNYFSKTTNYDLNKISNNSSDLDKLIEISYKSPRDMIRLFSIVFDEQSILNPNVRIISKEALNAAKINFCKSFDYYSVFPSKRGSKEDIISIVNRILRVGKIKFKTTDLVNEFKFSQQSAINYIKIYKDYGLVKDDDLASGNTKAFEVTDPKICYMIKYGLKGM